MKKKNSLFNTIIKIKSGACDWENTKTGLKAVYVRKKLKTAVLVFTSFRNTHAIN